MTAYRHLTEASTHVTAATRLLAEAAAHPQPYFRIRKRVGAIQEITRARTHLACATVAIRNVYEQGGKSA